MHTCNKPAYLIYIYFTFTNSFKFIYLFFKKLITMLFYYFSHLKMMKLETVLPLRWMTKRNWPFLAPGQKQSFSSSAGTIFRTSSPFIFAPSINRTKTIAEMWHLYFMRTFILFWKKSFHCHTYLLLRDTLTNLLMKTWYQKNCDVLKSRVYYSYFTVAVN